MIDWAEPKKNFRFAEQKSWFDFFGSTPTRPTRNLTRTFPKIEPKFGLQNLPINSLWTGRLITVIRRSIWTGNAASFFQDVAG